jgi:TrmH family RNA methyltransferase
MNAKTVTSLSNTTVKAVRALHMRKEREESGLFLAEGLKIVIEAIDCGHAPKILMYGRDAADHPMLQKASQACLKAGGEVIEVNREILEKVSRRDNPQAVVGVFKQVYTPLSAIVPESAPAGWPCRPCAIRATWAP